MRPSQQPFILRRLKVVADIRPSGVDKLTLDSEQLVSLCNYVDVYKNSRISSALSFMQASATLAEVERFTLQSGDVLITKDSETSDDIAAAALVEESAAGVVCGYHLALLRPKGMCRGNYLYWCLNSPDTLSQFSTRAQGITRFGLTVSAIGEILVPMPPTNSQRAIASFLDRETGKIDALVGEQERLVTLLKEKRQAVISQAVTKGLDPTVPMKNSGVDWLGEVPAHWEILKTKQVSMIFVPQRNKPELNFEGIGTCWMTMEDMVQEEVHETTSWVSAQSSSDAGSRILKAGAVIASCVGTYGIASTNLIDVVINQQLQAFIPDDCIEARYLRYSVSNAKSYFESIGTAATISYVNQQGFGNMPLVGPPSAEQKDIVDFPKAKTSQIKALCEEAEHAVALLRERRAALIATAVTGKIDVRAHADMPSAQAA